MEKHNKEKQEQAKRSDDYVTTVREGAIGANIFRGKTQDGYEYHYFELSRAWKNAKTDSPKFRYSPRFFSRNAEAISQVAQDAARKCDELDGELENRVPEHERKAA